MKTIPIELVAARLRRTSHWVSTELLAASIRKVICHDPLTLDELESLVAYIKGRWVSSKESARPTSPPAVATIQRGFAPPASNVRRDKHGLPPLSPAEKREIALSLLDVPEEMRASLMGQRPQLRLTAAEVKKICQKRSSSVAINAQVLSFVRSSEFSDLYEALRQEILSKAPAANKSLGGMGSIAPPRQSIVLERNPMAKLDRLPQDWWREQL